MPAHSSHIALFMIGLLQQGLTFHVISSFVYAIKWQHALNGYLDPTDSVCDHLLATAKRIAKPRRNPKEPLTPAHLQAIFQTIGGTAAPLLEFRNFIILLLSYVGFLRFDEAAHLRRCDLAFFKTHLKIFIEGSKTDQYRDGHILLISRLHSNICPVKLVAHYLRKSGLAGEYESFLFRGMAWNGSTLSHTLRSGNHPISYSTARTGCLKLLAKIGLDSNDFGLHSARSGGATAAANRGVPDRLFKRHGRWVSESAKDSYIKDNFKKLLSVSQHLGI